MAASQTYKVISTDRLLNKDSMVFELDESDIWDMTARLVSPDERSPRQWTGISADEYTELVEPSKILKKEYRVNHRRDFDEDDFEDDDEDSEHWVPSHEFLARQIARMRTVHSHCTKGLVVQREF
ncbi:uncharacterized protein LOC111377538 [Olea europaea var. sylvestris]|uniref:uncharacterized protein LOC111377538 n=1 Tax=Olea europaea var. sylvestris TaxID=158386 RepID=UPI000C1CE638|nr:uncharacterized protein LOC111377538 [Olea europaea var. sylvestris]